MTVFEATVRELANVLCAPIKRGSSSTCPKTKVRGVSTDSRSIEQDNLFVALNGDNYDGHRFVEDAFGSGAAAAVVERPVASSGTLLIVEDALYALGQLASWYRARFDIPWIALTGSAGKTTTKEMLACILSSVAGPDAVLKPGASHNNRIGMPMTILRASGKHKYAIVEIGTNAPGEVAALAEIARPTIAAITAIGEAHLEGLGSVDGVAREKASLLRALPPAGLAVVPAESAYLDILLDHVQCRFRTFGFSESADYRAVDCRSSGGGMTFRLVVRRDGERSGDEREVTLSLPGKHNVGNALCALACAEAALSAAGRNGDRSGAGEMLDAKAASHGLSKMESAPMRSSVVRKNGVTVFVDCYNANPLSFRAALEAFGSLEVPGRRMVVAGDMLELGRHSGDCHRRLGREISEAGVDFLLGVGRQSRWTVKGACEAGMNPNSVLHAWDAEAAAKVLKLLLRPDDGVLVKGSRRMALERLVSAIAA